MSEITMFLPLIWLAICIILFILEIATDSVTSIWYSVSALVTAIMSFFITNLIIQVIVFVGIGTILLIFTKPIVKKLIKGPERRSDFIGSMAKVLDVIDESEGIYEVKVEGKIFKAMTTSKLDVSEMVVVLSVKGNVLEVRKKENK